MEAFWDDLSTWYVRRNRARFWKTESRRDSLAAYQTLYEALTTLARLFGPIMPFLSESLYQNLVRRAVPGAPESVHLTPYPEVRAERIDDDLERRMRAAMRVVSLGRTARSSAKTKVRTPLPKLIAVFDAPAELEAEGLARELAHHVNNMRKEAGLDIADRITLRYDGALGGTIERFKEFLAGEVLATGMTRSPNGRGHRWEGELNGVKGMIEIERA